MQFHLTGYLVSTGSYNTAVSLPSIFSITIGAPTDVILEADDRFLDPSDPGAVSVTIGDDEQGPVTGIEYRGWTLEEDGETVTYSFVRLERDNTAEFLLLPVDPITGQLVTQALPIAGAYVAGSTFDPVLIGPLGNDAPVAVMDEADIDEDQTVSIDVMQNDTDAEGDAIALVGVGEAASGTTEVVDGKVIYTPDADFTGEDTFAYTVTDGFDTAQGSVKVTVNPVNDAPEADDDAATTDEDVAVTIDVLDGDSDIDGDVLTISEVTGGSSGTTEIVDGEVVYTPNADANGEDTFTYTVTDGELTDTATVTVTVNAVNDAPVAADYSEILLEDTIQDIFVLDNDLDVDGDPLTVISVTSPEFGQAQVISKFFVEYTPDLNFNGEDTFTYTVSDGEVTDTATVTVTVTAVPDAPVAGDDGETIDEDGSISIDVLANDSDADGETLAIASVFDASFGMTEIVNGEIVYTPVADANGEDSFSYIVTDGGLTDTATVTVTVNSVNDEPMATDDNATMDEDTTILIDVIENDDDVEGDALSISAVGDASFGTVAIEGNEIRYTPDADAFGIDTFTYTLSDGDLTDTATVTVTVTDVPDTIPGGEGDEDFTPGEGVETYILGGGSDKVTGPVENFFGDTYQDFGGDDEIVFLEEIGRDQMAVTEGSAIIAIDTDGDGTSDGSFTLAGDFSGGDFMAVVANAETTVTFEDFLIALAERQAVDEALVNGIINQAFLTGNGTQDMVITLKDMGFANKDNVVGAYEVTETGEIVDTVILFDNANADKTASTVLSGVEVGHEVGFFLIQDGADWLAAQDENASFSFINGAGESANTADGDIVLAVDGVAMDQVTFHSYASSMNVDGIEHTLSGVDEGGESLTIGFEDLVGGGDRDYEDVVFSIEFIDTTII